MESGPVVVKRQRDLLLRIHGAARDLVHPLDTRPLGAEMGLTEAETDATVAALEMDGLVKSAAGQPGLVTLTAEGARLVASWPQE